jgi:hypothetical protein
MDSTLLDFLKSTSPLAVIIIVGITYALLRKLRADQKGDVRSEVRVNLGLQEGEKFDDKLNTAISIGFAASVHPLTLAVQGLTAAVAELRTEVKGLREATNDHGTRLRVLEAELASLRSHK